jgi:hypothetical protein
MDRRSRRIASPWPFLAGWLALTLPGAGAPAGAQTSSQTPGPDQASLSGQAEGSRPAAGTSKPAAVGEKPGGGQSKAKTKAVAKAKEKKKDAPPAAKEKAPGRGPGEDFQEGIRKTVEKRRERRARRAQALGTDEVQPPGAIAPWPMPPALIIRQTPQVHDEIGSLLGQLRRGG